MNLWRISFGDSRPGKQREYMGVCISIYMIDTPVAKGSLLKNMFSSSKLLFLDMSSICSIKGTILGWFDAWYTKMASSSRQFWQSIFRGGLPMGHQSIRVMCRAKINRKRVISWFVGFPTVRQNPPIQR